MLRAQLENPYLMHHSMASERKIRRKRKNPVAAAQDSVDQAQLCKSVDGIMYKSPE